MRLISNTHLTPSFLHALPHWLICICSACLILTVAQWLGRLLFIFFHRVQKFLRIRIIYSSFFLTSTKKNLKNTIADFDAFLLIRHLFYQIRAMQNKCWNGYLMSILSSACTHSTSWKKKIFFRNVCRSIFVNFFLNGFQYILWK